jgi:L-amino acid N-acyltransferase YncA
MVRELIESDQIRVLEIYKQGIETGNATFETSVPIWTEWDSKHLKHSRFVFEVNGVICGWVALSQVSTRIVYKGIAEVSIYVELTNAMQGIGSKLMAEEIKSSEENGIWTLQSSVFPENTATLKLHDKFGFRIVGRREKIASINGVWRDTLLLERRSKVVQ